MDDIIEAIITERKRQRELAMNGDTDKYDRTTNLPNDWVAYICAYAGRAATCFRNEREKQDFRTNMIKVAALAVAAIECEGD